MTYRDKVKQDRPDMVYGRCWGGVAGCPGNYYPGAPEDDGDCGRGWEECARCWDTEARPNGFNPKDFYSPEVISARPAIRRYMAETAHGCQDCINGTPIYPEKECCNNCYNAGSDCKVTHKCGLDCPAWRPKDSDTPTYTPPPMPKIKTRQKTNADRIRAMSNAQLRNFLAKVENESCESVWSKEFSKKFCDSCPTVTGKIEGCNKEMEFHECEFADGKCPHGNELDWWLRQPAKEET